MELQHYSFVMSRTAAFPMLARIGQRNFSHACAVRNKAITTISPDPTCFATRKRRRGAKAIAGIHPFLDGNGRMGRLLITLFLCSKDILQKPVLYLYHYFKANQQEYYERLQRVRDRGDWEGGLSSSFKELGLLLGKQRKQREKLWLSERIIDN
jgi:hypothetical protein